MQNRFKALVLILFVSLIATGCGGGVNEDKPISEVKEEAQKMAVDQLKSVVAKYQKAVESKKTEINALKEKLKEIPVVEMLGDEAKKIKTEITSVTKSINALTQRLKVYSQAITSKQ